MTPRDIIDLWNPRSDLARDLGEVYPTVAAWYSRNSIPANRHAEVVELAAKRGLALGFEDVVKAHARPRPETPDLDTAAAPECPE